MATPSRSDAQIRLLLVEDMAQVAQYIRSLVDAQSRIKLLDVVTDGRVVVEQIRELQPDVLIVDALLQGRVNGLQVATEVREAGIDLPIIALTVPHKPVSVGEGMGITRVLSMPFSGFDFMHLLTELHEQHRAEAPETFSRVYALYGAKGGVGTTTLAYNIAAAIAHGGQHSVALIDGSLQKGDLRALLDVPENAPSILQLPTSRVQKSELAEAMYRDSSGVQVLLAPPRIELAETILPGDLEKLISLMRQLFNVVIIDTASGVDDILLTYLDNSDQLVQVLTFEAAALRQARAMAQTLAAIGTPADRLRFIVNRADSTGGLPRDAISSQIGREPDFTVVSDGVLVLEANNRGEPFVLLAPDAPITRDIGRIARELTSQAPAAHAARSAG